MEVNWYIVGSTIFIVIILVLFLIKANRKDKKDLKEFLDKNEIDENKKEESELN